MAKYVTRPRVTRPCENCGQPVTGRADVRFCKGSRCREAARRARAAQQAAEAVVEAMRGLDPDTLRTIVEVKS